MSLFEQTQNEVEELFYATFPAARDAACNELFEQRAYDLPSPVDYPTLHATTQPFEYDIRNELEIGSSSVPFRGPNQELSYPESQFTHSEGLHPQQPFLSHHQIQPSYYSPPYPVSFFLSFFLNNFQQLFASSKMNLLYIFHRDLFIIIHLIQHLSISLGPSSAQSPLENQQKT